MKGFGGEIEIHRWGEKKGGMYWERGFRSQRRERRKKRKKMQREGKKARYSGRGERRGKERKCHDGSE